MRARHCTGLREIRFSFFFQSGRRSISGMMYRHASLNDGIRSEKCVVGRFRRCANVVECTYTDPGSTVVPRIKYSRTHVPTPPFLHNTCEISYPLHPWPPPCIQPTQVECSCLPMFLIYQPEDGQCKVPNHVVVLYVINYIHISTTI